MRKNTTFMFAAAVAALLLAGCDKGASYSSFELSTADFRGADGAKTHWAAQGLYWNEGDVVVINRNAHSIQRGDTCWYTSGPSTDPIGDYYFYVAYPYGTMSTDGTTVSGVDFSGGVVPLACKGKTNKLTLYPCCAVIKIVDNYWTLNFLKADGNTPGVVEGNVLRSGSIDVDSACVRGTDTIHYSESLNPVDLGEYSDGYNYFVIPMDGGVLRAKLSFDGHKTKKVVDLRAGYMYVINVINEEEE